MAFTVIELEYITPPTTGPIFGVPIGTPEQAFDLWQWADANPDYTCAMIAKLDDAPSTIQIEGRNSATVVSEIADDHWIVYNSGKLIAFASAEEALQIYRVKEGS